MTAGRVTAGPVTAVPGSAAGTDPMPVGMPIEVDRSTRQIGSDTLIGGDPRRALRLSARGRAAWGELAAGTVRTPAGGLLARRLTDAGLAHPRPRAAAATAGPAGEDVGPAGEDVKVLIPAKGRPSSLDGALAALGGGRRVLVVDDGSRDAAAIATVAAKHGAELLRRERSGGPAAARNAGLAVLDGEFVALLDSDCVPPPGWIDDLLAHFADPLVGVVAPRIVAAPDGRRGRARPGRGRGALDLGGRPARVAPGGRVAYVPTAALIVRRGALSEVAVGEEVFDSALRHGEDVDLVWRLDRAGWRVRYDPSVRVGHAEPPTWRALLARRYRYGTSAAPLTARHPGRLAPLMLEPWSALAVASLLLGRPRLAAAALAGGLLDERRAWAHAGVAPAGAGLRDPAAAVLGRAVRTWRAAGTYATQFGGPLLLAGAVGSVAHGRARPALAAAALLGAPPAASWWAARPRDVAPLAYAAAHVAEDVAYGAGVLRGALAGRTGAPLRPALARRGLLNRKATAGRGAGRQQ